MKTRILAIGKTKDSWLKTGIDEYVKRLQHYGSFEYVELPDVKNGGKMDAQKLKEAEAEVFLKHISKGAVLYLLDEGGKQYSSREMASFFEQHQLRSAKELVLIVGGAFGFSEGLYRSAQGKISLSKMTFSHQMIRPFLLEQVYRAQTILKGEKYHND